MITSDIIAKLYGKSGQISGFWSNEYWNSIKLFPNLKQKTL